MNKEPVYLLWRYEKCSGIFLSRCTLSISDTGLPTPNCRSRHSSTVDLEGCYIPDPTAYLHSSTDYSSSSFDIHRLGKVVTLSSYTILFTSRHESWLSPMSSPRAIFLIVVQQCARKSTPLSPAFGACPFCLLKNSICTSQWELLTKNSWSYSDTSSDGSLDSETHMLTPLMSTEEFIPVA